MQINIHADNMMRNFYQTGTLGQGAERTGLEGMEAALALMTRTNDSADIAAFDNKPGDRDQTPYIIDLSPDAAQALVPPGFGPVTSCRAEYKGEARDPESMTAEIDGPESRKIVHVALENDTVTIFEARSQGQKGLITAGKFTQDPEKGLTGYMEMLEIPWHMAR